MLQASLLAAGFDEISPLVEKALESSSDEAPHEAGIAGPAWSRQLGLLSRK